MAAAARSVKIIQSLVWMAPHAYSLNVDLMNVSQKKDCVHHVNPLLLLQQTLRNVLCPHASLVKESYKMATVSYVNHINLLPKMEEAVRIMNVKIKIMWSMPRVSAMIMIQLWKKDLMS